MLLFLTSSITPLLLSEFLFVSASPHLFLFGFTSEMCPNFKWKQIKGSCLSQAGGNPLQWPARLGLRAGSVPAARRPRLWLAAEPGGGRRRGFGAAFFTGFPSASVLPLRRRQKKENGGWQDMQIAAPPKEKEKSFPPGECERVLPLSHSHRTLNGTLSLDTHWPASTRNTHNHTNEFMHLFCVHMHTYVWRF